MQSKKRAKPVKFGDKNKTEPKEIVAPKTVEKANEEIGEPAADVTDKTDEGSVDKTVEKEHGAHGLEAHISRTTETIDIKEISDDSEGESIPAEKSSDSDKKEEEIIETSTNDESTDAQTESKSEEVASSDESAEPETSETAESSEAKEYNEENDSENEDEDEGDIADKENTDDTPVNKDGAFFNRPPDEYDQKKSSLPYFIMIVVITFIIGVVFFSGIYYAVQNKTITLPGSKNNAEISEAPVIEVPTKKPVDLSQYNIQVLNGTGTAGVAAKVREQLTTAGFKVGSVGNADSNEFEKTEISAAKKVDKEYLNKLKETLGEAYVVDEAVKLASGSADVVVTIGSETAK